MTIPNLIPSINTPLTDSNGRISATWHEFFRKFINTTNATVASVTAGANNIVAGNGLNSVTNPTNTTFSVGAGNGIVINAHTVGVDITDLPATQAINTHEVMVSSPTNNNTFYKTTLGSIANLSAAGGSDTYVQYNSKGQFAGASGFTYDGNQTIVLGSMTVNGAAFSTATNAIKFTWNVPAGTTTDHYLFRQTTGSGSSSMPVRFGSATASTDVIVDNNIDSGGSTITQSTLSFARSGATKWSMGLLSSSAGSHFVLANTNALNTGVVFTVNATTENLAMSTSLLTSTTAGITASTTQTQGQGPLTTDINEISTCAHANDTVTLPATLAGRSCIIINDGANTLQIFPASGSDLGAGLNTATTLIAGAKAWFVAYSTTKWKQMI